jgi:hypothetical protein
MSTLGPVTRVVLGALAGGAVTATIVVVTLLMLESRVSTGLIFWWAILGCMPGAIVGAVAGSTSAIVRALQPRHSVSWE